MALYFTSKAEAFRELRVGDAAVELYGKQTRADLHNKHSDPAKVYKDFRPEQRARAKAGAK